MPSTRERVILAVVDLVKGALPNASHHRNEVKQRPIPAGGYVNVDDGDPGEPEVTLSPKTYIYEHQIPIELAANKTRTVTAETALDTMLRALGAAIEVNRTLGGLCDYLSAEAATTEAITAEGAPVSRYALVTVVAIYGVTDPLN